MVNRQASWEDFLDLSLVGDVNEDLLVGCAREQDSRFKSKDQLSQLTDVSGLKIEVKFVDVQIIRVDEEHLVAGVVPDDSVAHADVVLELDQTVVDGEAVEATNAFVQVHDISLFFANHGSEVETALLVNIELVDANSVDLDFGKDLGDLSHDGGSVPVDKQQTTSSTDDELVFLAMDRNTEANGLLAKKSEHADVVVVVQVHAEDLSTENVAPVENVGVLAVEQVLSDEVHDAVAHLFNLVVRHV
jgi:hypothetical protein